MVGSRNTSSRYGAVAQAFHWVTAFLVLTTFVVSKGDRYSLYSAAAEGLRRIHETLGTLVFFVVLLHLLWLLKDRTRVKQPISQWMVVGAKLVRCALYVFLIAIPASAVLGTWLEGIPLTLVGFEISPLAEASQRVGQLIMELHITLGTAILWLAGIHAAAAVFHHFFLGDEVLRSMVPNSCRRRRDSDFRRARRAPVHATSKAETFARR